MAIFRKEHLLGEKAELARFYAELVAVLEGDQPSAGIAQQFHNTVEDFVRDYTDIDLARLERAISHFKIEVDGIKHIKTKVQKPIHRP